jgi:peroxiredoxin
MFTNLKRSVMLICLLFTFGCQEDLAPSNDQLESTQATREGETLNDISFTLSDGSVSQLSDQLTTHDAVVFYFTMWCPICEGHMSYIRQQLKPNFENVAFIFVDYVSGNVSSTLDSQQSRGYTDFPVISDFDDNLENYFNGTMATTIIVDKNFIVKLNGLFKTGNEIYGALEAL